MKNLLHVSGIVRDGTSLWSLLKAFEAVHAKDVEVRPVVTEPQLLLPPPAKKPPGSNQDAVLKLLSPEPVTNVKALTKGTGFTGKQVHMALYQLMKKKKVKKTSTGFYYTVGVAA